MKKFNSNSISRNNKYNGAGGAGGGTASDIAYDNSLSGLVSENVQQAIDELHDEIEIGRIYTTDEKKVGEWIDGKPIYSKVVEYSGNVTLNNNAYVYLDIDTSDIDITLQCYVMRTDDKNILSYVTVQSDQNKIALLSTRSTATQVNNPIVILNYTKK